MSVLWISFYTPKRSFNSCLKGNSLGAFQIWLGKPSLNLTTQWSLGFPACHLQPFVSCLCTFIPMASFAMSFSCFFFSVFQLLYTFFRHQSNEHIYRHIYAYIAGVNMCFLYLICPCICSPSNSAHWWWCDMHVVIGCEMHVVIWLQNKSSCSAYVEIFRNHPWW